MSDLRLELKTKIDIYGKHFVISTVELSNYMLEQPYETVVFQCEPDGRIISWDGVVLGTYGTEDRAIQGHQDIVRDCLSYKINLLTKIKTY